MTVCATGSHKKSTSPDFLHVDSAQYLSFLPPAVQWLATFLPYLPPYERDVNAFCALEPPDFPTLDALDLWAIIQRDPISVSATAINKVMQVVEHYAWYLLCECTSGGTPAPPAAPAPPAGLPLINPPALVSPPDAAPCATFTSTNAFCWVAGSGFSPFPAAFSMMGGSVSALRVTLVNTICSGAGSTLNGFITFQSATGVTLRNDPITAGPGATVTVVSYVPAGAANAVFGMNVAGSGGSQLIGSKVESFCNGAGPGPQMPCCPPDPGLLAKLDQVVAMVTLIQRQAVPFGYVPGVATHAGLVGSGEFAVQGLLGFLVQLTSVPPELGVEAGSPTTLFDAGWVTCGTADGWEKSTRVEHNPRLVVPEAMGLVTRIGYSFAPNVVATITELVREP